MGLALLFFSLLSLWERRAGEVRAQTLALARRAGEVR
jgi:hypothetical protein